MPALKTASLAEIEVLRGLTMKLLPSSIEEAAQAFAMSLATRYPSVVLARVFLVLPHKALAAAEQRLAASAAQVGALAESTPVLTLLGTAGRELAWRKRTLSQGHRAIPLLGVAQVESIPMVAKMLADLEVDFSGLDQGKPIETRRLLGSKNGAFFVADAGTTRDSAGRHVIPSQDFVRKHRVTTVFGMGGAYADGTLAVAIVFADEPLEQAETARFSSLISNFKMSTAELLRAGKIFRPE